MRRPSSPLFLALLLLLFLLPCSEAKKKGKQKSEGDEAASPPSASSSSSSSGRAVLSSGELSTKEGHRCTWEVREGRNNNALLQLSCSTAGEGEGKGGMEASYDCQFSGKPQECQAYVAKPPQYWKQVMGKLKKRANACEGEKVLKTRLCKKAPAAAHLKLTERKGDDGDGAKETGRKKGVKEGEKKEEKEKGKEAKEDEPMQGDFAEASDEQAEEAQSYCREGWHSVCRFFVKLLDG